MPFISSPIASFGTPNTAASATFGWVIEQVLAFLRIDVVGTIDIRGPDVVVMGLGPEP